MSGARSWVDVPYPGPWAAEALCRTEGPPAFFPVATADVGPAIAICAGCPVRGDCADYALAHPGLVGVWGGMDEEERRRARRRRHYRARAATPAGWVAVS